VLRAPPGALHVLPVRPSKKMIRFNKNQHRQLTVTEDRAAAFMP
jgi:hypothetical protein